MSLDGEIRGIDPDRITTIFDASLDKLRHPDITLSTYLIDKCFDGYPGFERLIDRLTETGRENGLNEDQLAYSIGAAAAVLFVLREYAQVQDMTARFPDMD